MGRPDGVDVPENVTPAVLPQHMVKHEQGNQE
jgi:hypothetical protein